IQGPANAIIQLIGCTGTYITALSGDARVVEAGSELAS
ncbi:hypothetical protein LCGC14_2397360, partial [marine sediment metagenome]